MEEKAKRDLLQSAVNARKNAYAPYSKFHVGCAILLNDGTVVNGVNIENASYPVVLCAERAAMGTIVSNGWQDKISAVAVATSSSPPGSPCGMCRQFLGEFLADDVPVIIGNDKGEYRSSNMAELLPLAFKKDALT